MTLKDRYVTAKVIEPRDGGGTKFEPRWGAIVRDGLIVLACLIFLPKLWPFYPCPRAAAA